MCYSGFVLFPQESGVIRVKSVLHHKVGEVTPPPAYTIMDQVVFRLELERKAGAVWVPHSANDVQVTNVALFKLNKARGTIHLCYVRGTNRIHSNMQIWNSWLISIAKSDHVKIKAFHLLLV